jgi:hypothetical protein
MAEKQFNEHGWVAVKHYQTIPHSVSINGYEYAFIVRCNICFSWIRPDDLDKLFAIKRHCCGDSYNPRYRLATEQDVRIWTGVSER